MDKDHWLKQLNRDVRTLAGTMFKIPIIFEISQLQHSLLCHRFIYKILFTVYNYLELL